MNMSWNFYCDESGNTGTDWMNSSQPYFVYGGWLIKENKENRIRPELYKLLSGFQEIDIKSKNVFKRSVGLKIFNNINDLMLNHEAFPIFVISDKRFMVAAKIVETFFDPEYNDSINNFMTYPIELKRSLATLISTDTMILEDFTELIRNGTILLEKYKKIQNQLYSLFVSHNQMEVANTIKILEDRNLLKMIDEFESYSEFGKLKNKMTLTIPTLSMLLQIVELFASIDDDIVHVYHDEIRGYNNQIELLKKIFFKVKTPRIFLGENNFILSNYPHINDIKFIKSEDEIFIQMSDLLCGFVYRVFQKVNKKVRLNDIEINLLKGFFVLHDTLHTWDYCAPNSFIQHFMEVILNKDLDDYDYNSNISTEFPKVIK